MNWFRAFLGRFSKALGALLGGATPASIVGVLYLLGVHVDPNLAVYLAPLVAAIGSALAPRNSYGDVPQAP